MWCSILTGTASNCPLRLDTFFGARKVITIGVDVAKNVFQIHGVDAEGAVAMPMRAGEG